MEDFLKTFHKLLQNFAAEFNFESDNFYLNIVRARAIQKVKSI